MQKNKRDFFLFLVLEVFAMVITGGVALTRKHFVTSVAKWVNILLLEYVFVIIS